LHLPLLYGIRLRNEKADANQATRAPQHLATFSPRIWHWKFLVIKPAQNLLCDTCGQAREKGDPCVLLAGTISLLCG